MGRGPPRLPGSEAMKPLRGGRRHSAPGSAMRYPTPRSLKIHLGLAAFSPSFLRSVLTKMRTRWAWSSPLRGPDKTPGAAAMSHHKRPQIMQPWMRLKVGHAGRNHRMRSRRLVGKCAFRITAIATFAVLAPLASLPLAQATDLSWYFGFQVPVMFIDDTVSKTTGSNRIQGNAVPYSAEATAEYKAGFKLAGMVGYRIGGSVRVEGELFFGRARVDKQTYANVASAGMPFPSR